MPILHEVMERTDWRMLAQQKLALIRRLDAASGSAGNELDGLLHWIDALQDAAEAAGFPVVWLEGGKADAAI